MTLRRCSLTACLVLAAACLLSARGYGSGLIDCANRADVVCVVSEGSAPRLETTQAEADPSGGSQWLATYTVTVQVKALWKGTLTGPTITLRVIHVERNGLFFPFKPFSGGSHFLVFAKKGAGGAVYDALDPSPGGEGFGSALPVGAISPLVTPQMPLLTKLLVQTIAGLDERDPVVRRTALGVLNDFEWLYVAGAPPAEGLPPGTDPAALKALITARAIPKLLRLTGDQDEETRFDALNAAAWLQQTRAIPAIAAMAESPSPLGPSVALALLHFENDAAVPLLIPQLRNKNPLARVFTIEAFERLRDRRTVPFLIDTLDDPDAGVQDRALYVLYAITGLPAGYTLPARGEDKTRGVRFWKSWEVDHRAEVVRLRKAAGRQR